MKEKVIDEIKKYHLRQDEIAFGLLYGPNFDLSSPIGLVSSKNDDVISLNRENSPHVSGIYYIRRGPEGNSVHYSFIGKRVSQPDFLNMIMNKPYIGELRSQIISMDDKERDLYESGQTSDLDVIIPVDSEGNIDLKPYLEGEGEKATRIRLAKKSDSVFGTFDNMISKHIDMQEMLKQYKRTLVPNPMHIFSHKSAEESDRI